MATFYTRPDITTRGMREPESISEMLTRFAQLQAFGDDRRYRRLREQEMSLTLERLRREEKDALAMRGAMAAGVGPVRPQSTPQIPGLESTLGPTMPQPQAPPGAAMGFDRQAALQALAQSSPENVPGMQQQFATQDASQREAMLKEAEQISKLNEAEFKNVKETSDYISNQFSSFMALPREQWASAWPMVRSQLSPQLQAKTPEQYPGDEWVLTHATGSQRWKAIVDADETHRRNVAMEGRETPHTQVVGDRVKQWNPMRKRFDIDVGPAPAREGGAQHLTPGQKAIATRRYKQALTDIEDEVRARQGGTFVDRRTGEVRAPMSDEELRRRKQDAEDAYKDELQAGGENAVSRFDYRTGRSDQSAPGDQFQTQHKVGDVVTYKGKRYRIGSISGGSAKLVPLGQ